MLALSLYGRKLSAGEHFIRVAISGPNFQVRPFYMDAFYRPQRLLFASAHTRTAKAMRTVREAVVTTLGSPARGHAGQP